MKSFFRSVVFGFALVSVTASSTAQAGKLEIFSKLTKYLSHTPKKPINYHLRGKKHPKTGVAFSKDGYPLFKAIATCNMRLSAFQIQFDKFSTDAKIRTKHFKICSKQLYKKTRTDKKLRSKFTSKQLRQLRNGQTPDGYTWHHEPQKNILTLVERDIHSQTAHSGGFSLHHK